MQVTILFMIHRGKETITLHDDETQAWNQLLKLIDIDTRGSAASLSSLDADDDTERVAQYFAAGDGLYVIANDDASEIAAVIDDITGA